MTKRNTRRALLMSALSLVLCMSMLIGSTFAWFTDSVTSSGNKIQSGTLKLDLELLDKESRDWNSIKEDETELFYNDKWEPGYTETKVLKVENEGNLALKWYAKFISTGEVSKLADAIDVYVNAYGVLDETAAKSVAYPADRKLDGYTKVGTLAEFINTIETTTYGSLEAGESAYLGLALKMQEEAGNEYQGLDLAGAFDIKILATQLTSEEDSFDDQYDVDAQYPGEVATAEALIAALSNNESVKLTADIDLSGTNWVPIATYSAVLDGNGYAIQNLKGENGLFDQLSGATVKNLKLENVDIDATSNHTGAVAGYVVKSAGKQTVITNVTVSGTVDGGDYYTGGLVGADSNYDTIIKGCANNATVVGGSNYTGGIVGYATRGSVIDSCSNNASVTGGSFVGGIVGFAAGDDTMPELSVVIKNCANTGAVSVTNTTVGWADCVGGIVGAFGRVGGDSPVVMLTFFISDCSVVDGQKVYGRLYNVATGGAELIALASPISDGLFSDTNGNLYICGADGFESFYNWIKDPTNANYNKRLGMWGKTFNLMSDVDASDITWECIRLSPDSSTAKGFTFNGNGYTISNLTITPTTSGTASAGLFTGATKGGDSDVVTSFNDVTFDNVTVNGTYYHNGVVWAEAFGSLSLNKVSVVNSKVVGRCNVGGLIGRNTDKPSTFTFTDCTVKNTVVEATKQGDNAGASAFLGMALHIGGTSCSVNVVFEGNNVAEGNTLTTAEGMQGGGIYAIATWAEPTWDTPTVVYDFTNYNSNN